MDFNVIDGQCVISNQTLGAPLKASYWRKDPRT